MFDIKLFWYQNLRLKRDIEWKFKIKFKRKLNGLVGNIFIKRASAILLIIKIGGLSDGSKW